MARTTPAVLLALALPTLALAQGKPLVEIGTNLGVAISSSDGASATHFGIPGQGLLGQPTIYASFFAGRSVIVEPQVALNILSSEGETATTVGLGAQLGYLTKGSAVNSLFVAASLGFQSYSGGGSSNNDFGLGGKVGYRVVAGSSVGVRFEAGFRRWVDSHLNEFTFGVGIGGIISRSR